MVQAYSLTFVFDELVIAVDFHHFTREHTVVEREAEKVPFSTVSVDKRLAIRIIAWKRMNRGRFRRGIVGVSITLFSSVVANAIISIILRNRMSWNNRGR